MTRADGGAAHPATDGGRPVVVTGALGFVGAALSDALLRRGDVVVGVDRLPEPDTAGAARLRRLQGRDAFRYRPLDLADGPVARALEGAATVYHLAAATGLRRSPAEYVRDNVTATTAVADAALATGARLVHASTSSVYGSAAVGDETAPTTPASDYGRTKLAAERAVQGRRELGLDAVVLRLFSVYGPDQRNDMAYHRLIRAALTGTTFTIYGTGRQTRTNTYVDDVVSAFLLSDAVASGTVMNVCGGQRASLLEVIDLVGALCGSPVAVAAAEGVPGDQVTTDGDAGLARRLLGWAPQTSLADGLERQIAWQQAQNLAVPRLG